MPLPFLSASADMATLIAQKACRTGSVESIVWMGRDGRATLPVPEPKQFGVRHVFPPVDADEANAAIKAGLLANDEED